MESIRNRFFKLPKELLLVIYAASAFTEKNGQRLVRFLSDHSAGLDWKQAFVLADTRHRVAAPVFKHLSQYGSGYVPEDALNQLKEKFKIRRSMMLQKTGELIKLVRLFNDHGINALPIKGPALSMQLHGDPCMRFSTDLDIVVPKEQLMSACEAMENAGYRPMLPATGLTPKQMKIILKKSHHFGYLTPANHIKVELHWKLTKYEAFIPQLQFQTVWEEKQSIGMGGIDIPVLSPSHTLLFLSVHGATHGWYRFTWLLDIAALLCKYENVRSWQDDIVLSETNGTGRIMAQSFLLGSLVFGITGPSDAVIPLSGEDPSIIKLCHLALTFLDSKSESAGIFSFMEPGYYQKKRYDFLLFKSPRFKLQYLGQHMSTIQKDWEYLSLPDRLFFLYHLLRPFFWIFRRFKSEKQKFTQTKTAD